LFPQAQIPTLIAALALAPDQPPTVPHLQAIHTDRPPLIDGRLDDPVWRLAPGTQSFRQYSPFDGAEPSERTTVRVLYDQEAIYVGFDCEQTHTPILEHLTRRDRDSESEWVWVQIDSRNDGKSAFVFAVNIAGTLADAQIIDQTTYSWEWDENWEGRTARTPTGWSAEIRIPVRALRYDGTLPVQSWGFQATRFIAQRQETDMWAYFPRDVATPLAYLGRLEDLRGLKGVGALELLPFVVADLRQRDPDPAANTLGSKLTPGGSAGLYLKWHATHDLTLDAAFNPDFAQVEADQVILNLTNFETFFPEKRPFFLEGIDAFSFPLQVFYSRRIGAAPLAPTLATSELLGDVPTPATIYGAGKLVGRIGPEWTLGALSALTGENSVAVVDSASRQQSNRVAAPTTAFNVLRLKRELGNAGHLGLIFTGASAFESTSSYPVTGSVVTCPSGATTVPGGRCFHDAYVGGFDGRWRSTDAQYVIGGALIGTYVRGGPEAPLPELDGTVIGPGSTSPGGWFRVAKEGGKHLLWSAEYTGAGRKLQYNDVGFMPRQNVQTGKLTLGWRTLEPGEYTLENTSAFEASESRNLSGLDLGQLYELNTRLRLLNFASVFAAADLAPARFDDREVGDGTALERARYLGWRLELASDPRGWFAANLANQTQIVGAGTYATNAQATLVLHALRQLDIELLPQLTWSAGEYRYARQASVDPTADYVFGRLSARSVSATLRATYTFTPQLTLQAYTQAFLASGHFSDLRAIPRTGTSGAVVHLSDLSRAAPPLPNPDLPPPALTPNPDFEDASLNVNVVLRWEYRLGSTIYAVYSHSQIPTVVLGPTATGTVDLHALGHGAAADVFLLKFSYWWAS
jgi:hypothetical protein